MPDISPVAFYSLVNGQEGHFRLESGHHAARWLDLDPLFAEPRRVDPFVHALARAIQPYRVDVICGPLVGGAFLAQLVARDLDLTFCYTERHESGDAGMYATRYVLPPASHSLVRNKRVAIVDDVMSAGSALRGTHASLNLDGAVVAVAGALMVLGSRGLEYFAEHAIPVEATARDDFDLWLPDDCPLCARGVAVVDSVSPRR